MQKLLNIYNALFDFWARFPETIRYLLVGGYNTAVYYAIYVLLLLRFGENYAQQSLFAAFVLSSFHSYFTQRTFVFLSEGDFKTEYVKCLIIWGLGYVMQAFLLYALTTFIHLNAYISELIALIFATFCTYFLLKYFAFGKDKK